VTDMSQPNADQIIAETAFQIVKHKFGEVDGDDLRCFRIKNLSVSAISAFLDVWTREVQNTPLARATVVIAGDADASLPATFRADPEKSITWYRNNNSWGLVYVDTKTQSDEQGLQNLFTLRDSNFLDGSFDSTDFDVADQVVANAWRVASSRNEPCPTLLRSRLKEVLGLIHPNHVPVSIRKFANFALKACADRIAAGGTLNPEQIDELIGACLVELDMFPDDVWRQGQTESRISRRLVLNAYRADLSSGPTIDLDPEEYAALSLRTVFKNKDGQEYQGQAQKNWQQKCATYCEFPAKQLREEIPYFIFEQLFSKDTRGLKIGERVEQEIHAAAPERLPEFEGLQVREGLNRRTQEDAQKFLEAIPDVQEMVALKELLTVRTRRLVERTAYPAAQPFENPLTKLAKIATDFRERAELDGAAAARIEVALAREHEISPLVGLFAFLFGPTLKSVMDAAAVESGGFTLKVDDRLLTQSEPPPLMEQKEAADDEPEEDPESGAEEVTWLPIPLEFRLIDSASGNELDAEFGLEWSPKNLEWLALFWLLCAGDDRPPARSTLHVPPEGHYRDWIKQVTGRLQRLDASASPVGTLEDDGIFREIVGCRAQLIDRVADAGLDRADVEGMLDKWQERLRAAKSEYVPNGMIDPRIAALLSLDTLALPDGGTIILPTHPFKLRWIARYLQRSEELAVKALAGELPLNSINPDLYLNWIGQLLPNQQPPVTINTNREILFSSGDLGWAEMFAPMTSSGGRSHSAQVDALALDEISRQITTFLENHPYKSDGLSILVILAQGDRLPSDLVKRVRKGEWRNIAIDMHVLAPKAKWEAITNAFEELSSDNRMSEGEILFPPLQLKMHEFRPNLDLQATLGELVVDIAVVPQFLGDKIDVQQNTEAAIEPEGAFDPLLDQPTFVSGGSAGGSIAVKMLPRAPDPAFEAWSTLVVRQHRTTAVAPQQPENVDLIELRIDFQDSSKLFDLLHQRAQWVLTLERHITREQIESLESRPEVLIIRENVGANGLYKLIVSSNSGRKFIIDRLGRRLGKFAASAGGGPATTSVGSDLATKIYEETRKLAPRLTLQATGVSRVIEEILGLMIARHVAERHLPTKVDDGIVTWLPLDEHPEWFVGDRADFCRIALERRDEELWVDILVVEGKLRKAFDDHWVNQIRQTLALLRDVMPSAQDGDTRIDAQLWREQLLSAMENISPESRHAFGRAAEELASDPNTLPLGIRTRFREGQFKVRSLTGLCSLCRHDDLGTMTTQNSPGDDITVVRTFQNHLLELVTPWDPDAAPSPLPTASPPSPTTEPSAPPEAAPPPAPTSTPQAPTGVAAAPTSPAAPPLPASVSSTVQDASPAGSDAALGPQGKLSTVELEKRYQHILDLYGEFGIPVQAPTDANERFVEGPATVLYRVRPGLAVDPKGLYAKADALKLALELGEEQSIRFSIDKGFVNVDVPKQEADRYFVVAKDLWAHWTRPASALATPLGEDRYGQVVAINFSSSNSPHLLIGGTTGSGKSEALNTILAGLARNYPSDELNLLLIDPKGTELQGFTDSPHLGGRQIGWDEEDAKALLKEAVQEMQQRYQLFRQQNTKSLPDYNATVSTEKKLPWWVLVLDEYADLTSDSDAKKDIEANLKRLAQKARAAGIHVIIATQKPSAEVISTNLRSNLPAQLALRVKSSTESRVIMDEAGAESLNGKGDAFLKTEGRLTRVQCAKV
jgi:S-DNA-T family DNA segregation ATPase FtsK/SpoIIIE